MTDAELVRFFAKIEIAPNGCWLWLAAILKPSVRKPSAGGYGLFNAGGRTRLAHRVSYEHFVGPLPPLLDHFVCDTRCCVNPDHLRPATQQENTLRGTGPSAANATKTHCPQQHPYDDENTHIDKTGRRHCRTCARARRKRMYRLHDGAAQARRLRALKKEK